MAKALKIAALVATVAAVAIVTGGAGLGLGLSLSTAAFGVSAGTLIAASAVLGAGASLLSPKPKAPDASAANAARMQVQIEARATRKIIFGSTAMATDMRDQEFTQDGTYCHRFLVVASHRVTSIREIWFDDKLAWTVSGGAQGEFAPWLQVTPVLEGSAANAINISPRMGASRRFTGLAYVYLRYTILAHSKKTDSVFNTSIPSRVTIIGDGAPVYDPRLDSLVPGGSGSMRADDQSTWAWHDSAARNPVLQMLFYLLGWRIQNPRTGAWKLAVGKGIPSSRIDLASFITAANLCDEPAAIAAGGSEPRYRADGIFSEGDDPQLVLDNLKAAANATLDDIDGRIRVTVLHNDLATPLGELTTADVLGEFTWNQTAPLSDCINIIRGAYTDPSSSSLYQAIDAPEVRVESVDGIDRIQTVNLPLVQSPSQWQRLTKQRLQRMQFGGTFTAVFQATAWKYQKNDVVRFTFGPLGWYQKLFRIAEMTVQVDGTVPLLLREEHPAIYAHDGTDAAPITSAPPATYDPRLWPILAGLVDVDTRLDQIFSDNVITHGREKRELILDWASLEATYNATEAQWAALGSPNDIAPQRNDARDAFYVVAGTLSRLQPAWDDVTQDTPIDGAALNGQWITARRRIEVFASAIRGRPGKDGAPGARGADGRTQYTHFAYANSANGYLEFTTNSPDGRRYRGEYTDTNPLDSDDPAAYTWVEYTGPRDFGFATNGDVVLGTTYAYKYGSSQNWDSQLIGTEGFRGGIQLSFRIGSTGCAFMAGLNSDPFTNWSWDTLDYAFYVTSDGKLFAAENGNPLVQDLGTYSQGDLLMIRYDNKRVQYQHNGAIKRSIDVAEGQLLFVDTSFQNPGARMDALSYAPAGAAGSDGLVVSASPPAFVIPAFSGGVPKPEWQGGSCVIRLQKGGQEITDGVDYGIVGVNGITSPSINGKTVSFAGVAAEKGEFTVRATYQGKSYDQRVTVTKVRDGEAAFKGVVVLNLGSGADVGLGSVTVPGGRDATLSAELVYYAAGNAPAAAVVEMAIFWRNETDGGDWNFLNGARGSQASRIDRGRPGEPEYEDTPGSVSVSGTFKSPSPDKQIGYRASIGVVQGSLASAGGTMKLEVTG